MKILYSFVLPKSLNVQMKPRVLIIPAAIRSHVLPSLYVADKLSEEGYEVHYAVTNDILAELVTKNGYQAVKNTGWRAGYGMEASYIGAKKEIVSYRLPTASESLPNKRAILGAKARIGRAD